MLSRINLLIRSFVLFTSFHFGKCRNGCGKYVSRCKNGGWVFGRFDNLDGRILNMDTQYGLLIKPNLRALLPGRIHGLHIYVNPDCSNKGEAAGVI